MAEMELIDSEQHEALDTVLVTPAAAERLQALMREKNLPATQGLRVFVAGGGCSGMQYGMAFDHQPRETDHVFESDGLRLFVDPVSMMYISGAQIDYVDSLMGGGFRIDNPQAVATCGCGHSFRTSGTPASSGNGGCAH
jgi:iron-sulfur cluster assembly protein